MKNKIFTSLLFLVIVGLYVAILIGFVYLPLNTSVNKYDFLYDGETEGEKVQITIQTDENAFVTQRGIAFPPFTRFSLSKGLMEVAKGYGKILSLPKWISEGMVYADVYIGPVIIITFSDKKTEDFRSAEISIEAAIFGNPPNEATIEREYEDMKQHAADNNSITIRDSSGNIDIVTLNTTTPMFFDVGNIHVTLVEGYPPIAYFWKNSVYYIVSAKPPLTSQDLMEIVKSMGD